MENINKNDYKNMRNEDLNLTAAEAVKETASFGLKLGAVALGSLVGATKSVATGIRSVKADKDSVIGSVARKSVKGNYKTSQYLVYDTCLGLGRDSSTQFSKEDNKNDLDS